MRVPLSVAPPRDGLQTPSRVASGKGITMSVRKSIILLTPVASPQAAAAQQTAPASAPAVFDVADRAAIFVAHGVGAQIYECKVGDTAATNWVFREPVATLKLGGGTIGHHYVGPTWELTDGEAVKGKQSAAGQAPHPVT